jgi:nucleotide-binding universal stress UspA family protein
VRSPSADERATVEAQLRALIPAEAGDHRIATNVSVISGDDVAESIIAAAERVDADVIVVGSHARSGIERALMGSIAESVERHALRPVLIVRSRAP